MAKKFLCNNATNLTTPEKQSLRQMKNKNQLDATFYFIVLIIGSAFFRALLCPSSGARDYNVVYHIGRFVLGLL